MALSETDRKRWDELHEHWNSKMKEQQEVAKKLSKCLDAEDGLVDNSKKVIKNLDAAIVASTQPGYFKYYQPTDNVQKIEERKEIDRLQKRIKSLQNEMDQAKKENRRDGEKTKRKGTGSTQDIKSFSLVQHIRTSERDSTGCSHVI